VSGIEFGVHLQHFHGHVMRAAHAGGRVAQLARIPAHVLDQLLRGRIAGRWIDHDEERKSHHETDRHEILPRVVGECLEECRVEYQGPVIGTEYRVAIGRRLGHERSPDHRRSAGTVVDDELLARLGRHLCGNGSGKRIGTAARRVRHDPLDRLDRKGLRGDCGSTCKREPEDEAGNDGSFGFHGLSPVMQ
jgi:hypothetical protein